MVRHYFPGVAFTAAQVGACSIEPPLELQLGTLDQRPSLSHAYAPTMQRFSVSTALTLTLTLILASMHPSPLLTTLTGDHMLSWNRCTGVGLQRGVRGRSHVPGRARDARRRRGHRRRARGRPAGAVLSRNCRRSSQHPVPVDAPWAQITGTRFAMGCMLCSPRCWVEQRVHTRTGRSGPPSVSMRLGTQLSAASQVAHGWIQPALTVSGATSVLKLRKLCTLRGVQRTAVSSTVRGAGREVLIDCCTLRFKLSCSCVLSCMHAGYAVHCPPAHFVDPRLCLALLDIWFCKHSRCSEACLVYHTSVSLGLYETSLDLHIDV